MAGVIVADANVVIAATNPRHVHHETAARIVLDHAEEGIVLHSLTLAEILVGPARAGALEHARARLEAAGFMLAASDPSPEAVALVRATTTLKMPDACVLATAEALRVPLATFDHRLAREAAARHVSVMGAGDH